MIAQRYLSTVQVARIFRGGQLIRQIRVDFRSNDDLQEILQCLHISIESIRYPTAAYKPLARTNLSAISAGKITNTIEIVRLLSNTPIEMQYDVKREANQQPSISYLSSPARLYSAVIQTIAPHVHAETKTSKMSPDRPTGQVDQSSIIIQALKEQIGRS